MKIGLIGDFSKPMDEGQKGVARHLASELSRRHDVTELNLTSVFKREFWCAVRHSDIQLIHYVPGPTIKSLVICRIIAAHHGVRIVVSALQPRFTALSKSLIPFLKPDLVLVQSKRWARWFEACGCITSLVPNGVDIDRFTPILTECRQELRNRFALPQDCFLVLHVGHITHRRNIEALARIQGNGRQVFMVASEYTRTEKALHKLLKERGCLVLKGYVPDIEQIYAMSDCYVFPVKLGDTILTPLSVLEAMACNLPVVSRRFEGLTEMFTEQDGLSFFDSDADVIRKIKDIEANRKDVRTRDKVLPYSWSSVAERIERLYQQLLAEV